MQPAMGSCWKTQLMGGNEIKNNRVINVSYVFQGRAPVVGWDSNNRIKNEPRVTWVKPAVVLKYSQDSFNENNDLCFFANSNPAGRGEMCHMQSLRLFCNFCNNAYSDENYVNIDQTEGAN